MTLTGHREEFLRLTFSLELMLEISAAETLYEYQVANEHYQLWVD